MNKYLVKIASDPVITSKVILQGHDANYILMGHGLRPVYRLDTEQGRSEADTLANLYNDSKNKPEQKKATTLRILSGIAGALVGGVIGNKLSGYAIPKVDPTLATSVGALMGSSINGIVHDLYYTDAKKALDRAPEEKLKNLLSTYKKDDSEGSYGEKYILHQIGNNPKVTNVCLN